MQWPPTHWQSLSTSSHAIAAWNQAAHEIILGHRQYPIDVMDAYWLTLARPDHRECTYDNARGNKMAHAGNEVYQVLVRQMATILLETMAASSR